MPSLHHVRFLRPIAKEELVDPFRILKRVCFDSLLTSLLARPEMFHGKKKREEKGEKKSLKRSNSSRNSAQSFGTFLMLGLKCCQQGSSQLEIEGKTDVE